MNKARTSKTEDKISLAVESRLFDKNGTPTPHDDYALIVFGGKKYSMAIVDANSNLGEFSESVAK